MQTTTVGVFKDRVDAEAAARELREIGVIDTEIANVPIVSGLRVRERGHATGIVALLGALLGGAYGAGLVAGYGPITAVGTVPELFGISAYQASIGIGVFVGLILGTVLGALLDLFSDAAVVRTRADRVMITIHSIRGGLRQILEKYHAHEIREYTDMLAA